MSYYGNICSINSNNSGNSNAFTKAQSLKELFEYHRNLMSTTRTAKIEAETAKAPYSNHSHEKNIKTSVADGERQQDEANFILDKIAGGMKSLKHELMLVGEEAAKRAQYIDSERRVFALQLKNCKTREDAERLYHAKVRSITYGIIDNPPKQNKEMIGRYVRTMRNEWSRHIALMK